MAPQHLAHAFHAGGFPVAPDDDEELLVKYARLLATLATEVMDSLKRVENGVCGVCVGGGVGGGPWQPQRSGEWWVGCGGGGPGWGAVCMALCVGPPLLPLLLLAPTPPPTPLLLLPLLLPACVCALLSWVVPPPPACMCALRSWVGGVLGCRGHQPCSHGL